MGSRTERLLLEDIEELGYRGVKVDFAGGAGYHVGHDAGDIIAGQPKEAKVIKNEYGEYDITSLSELFIIEEKYRSNDTSKYIQVQGEKFDSMINFANAIGATPVLAARWSSNLDWSPGPHHLLRHAEEVERTKSGNVNLIPEEVEQRFQRPKEFF